MKIYHERALNFCTYIRSLCNDERKKIDFVISGSYITFFFYFKFENSFDTTHVIDELNCGLKVFNLNEMSEFYMKLNNIECLNYNMCWSFFSYNKLEKFFR